MNSIVVGSGFGGIAAALRLKAKGHQTRNNLYWSIDKYTLIINNEIYVNNIQILISVIKSKNVNPNSVVNT